MNERRDEPRGCRRGCIRGCVAAALLGIVVLASCTGWSFLTLSRFDEAVANQRALDDIEPFVPPVTVVDPERLDAYLRVRRATQHGCEALSGTMGELGRIREQDVSGAADALSLLPAAFATPSALAAFLEMRNAALLAEDMTLEEYRWYTLLAYWSPKGDPFRSQGPTVVGRASLNVTRLSFAVLLIRAREEGDADWRAVLEAENERLQADLARFAFEDALPPSVRAVLKQRGDELRELDCQASRRVELEHVQRDGLLVRID